MTIQNPIVHDINTLNWIPEEFFRYTEGPYLTVEGVHRRQGLAVDIRFTDWYKVNKPRELIMTLFNGQPIFCLVAADGADAFVPESRYKQYQLLVTLYGIMLVEQQKGYVITVSAAKVDGGDGHNIKQTEGVRLLDKYDLVKKHVYPHGVPIVDIAVQQDGEALHVYRFMAVKGG